MVTGRTLWPRCARCEPRRRALSGLGPLPRSPWFPRTRTGAGLALRLRLRDQPVCVVVNGAIVAGRRSRHERAQRVAQLLSLCTVDSAHPQVPAGRPAPRAILLSSLAPDPTRTGAGSRRTGTPARAPAHANTRGLPPGTGRSRRRPSKGPSTRILDGRPTLLGEPVNERRPS